MKHLKQFYSFLKRLQMAILESFSESLTSEPLENGLQTSYSEMLYQLGNDFTERWERELQSETKELEAFRTSNKSIPKSPKKKNLKKAKLEISDYVVSQQGQLCHKHLIALELNTIYQSQYENLMFGFDGKK